MAHSTADVLAAWRAAERELAGLLEASPQRMRVRAEVARLRDEYHRMFEAYSATVGGNWF